MDQGPALIHWVAEFDEAAAGRLGGPLLGEARSDPEDVLALGAAD